jgi:IS605 OrfB family transposase
VKTIKLPYKTTEDLTPILKQYSNVVRYSYNRFLEGKTEKDVRLLTKSLNSIDLLNSWLIQCGIKDGKAIQTRFKNEKVIFGGKHNLIKRSKNKISKEEYQLKRLCPINIQGEELKQGNRSFKLDIIENNQIIFKLNKSAHIKLELPHLRNNIKNDLYKLQQLNEVKNGEKGYKFTVRLDLDNIYISFEEFKDAPIDLNKDRYMGIDMNPDAIGISILENGKVIHAQEFSLKPIYDKIFSEKLASNSPKMKYYHNKLRHEIFEISKSISNLAKYYKCKFVFIEELNLKNKTGNKKSNRNIKNLWKREVFTINLKKRLNIYGIKLFKVYPAYSSFIGNMMYDYTDSVNASIEIARRGYEVIIKKNSKKFYPDLEVKHQWKEMATVYTDWKEFYTEIKNQELKYRVSLDECSHSFRVLQQNSSHKSMVLNYVFYD